MPRSWIAFTGQGNEEALRRAISSLGPIESLVFAPSAAALREMLHEEEPRSVAAAVGLGERGVSDVNAAAAVVADGMAEEVVLVVRGASGSLRSRSSRAGITRVIDLDELERSHAQAEKPVEVRAATREEPRVRAARDADDLATGDEGAQEEAPVSHEAHPDGEAAPVLTFASGRGGVGKTSLVAAAAMIAAGWGLNVAVCDLDLTCGNLANAFGVARTSDLATLATSGVTDEAAQACGVRCAEGVTLWGPVELPEMAETVMPLTDGLLSFLARSHDLVLVDTPATCTDAVARAMVGSTRLVLVHDEAPGGIAALSRMGALAVRLGVARTRIVRVENRCPLRAWGRPAAPRAELALETARLHQVPDGGVEVMDLMASGAVAELVELGGDFVKGVESFMTQCLRELGRLPQAEIERAELADTRARRGFSFFGRRKEAV